MKLQMKTFSEVFILIGLFSLGFFGSYYIRKEIIKPKPEKIVIQIEVGSFDTTLYVPIKDTLILKLSEDGTFKQTN